MRKSPVFLLLASGAVLASSVAFAQPAPDTPAAETAPVADPEPADAAAAPTAEESSRETPPPEGTDVPSPDASAPSAEPAEESPSAGSIPAPLPTLPQPRADADALMRQGAERPSAVTPREEKKKEESERQVFAEDWWSHARPILELHGYFRVRTEMFHRFSLGRINEPNDQLWPAPLDTRYQGVQDPTSQTAVTYGPTLCTAKESPGGVGDSDDPRQGVYRCRNNTQMGANMRFRLNPELHISDNLRVISQIDLLDNLVMGSTPQGYAIQPDAAGGYETVARGGYNPISLFDVSQEPPTSGVNGLKDSIRVKRVWGEYQTPVGELRFGRMPSHWGLGILDNSGDDYDDDYQTTVDRLMFVTGVKPLDLYVSAAWDFANEGATSANVSDPQAQAYDVAQRDDVRQIMFSVARRQDPALVQQALSNKKLVFNGGLYFLMRWQVLANDRQGNAEDAAVVPGAFPGYLMQEDGRTGFVRRDARIWVPDLWLQLRYQTFRFEAEAVTIQGNARNLETSTGTTSSDFGDYKFRMWGLATETEFRAIEEKLKIDFKFGWASGDAEASESDLPGGGGLVPGYGDGMQDQIGDNTWSTFAFHPSYRVDLILNRNILSRVQGSYYFRPGVEYDFLRNPDGQRLGGGFSAIWTRASEFMQTPGHKRDLGIELNGKVYFQAKDGALNDLPGSRGGFYTQLEYGVLFPLGGLGYQQVEKANLQRATLDSKAGDPKAAQILRWYIGVLF